MQDNVGDAGGLFKSLDPASCGAVPASSSAPVPIFLIQCSGSSLPHPVLQIQSIPHPLLQFQSTSSNILVPCSLPHPLLRFQSTSSITPVHFNFLVLFLFLDNFFFTFKFHLFVIFFEK